MVPKTIEQVGGGYSSSRHDTPTRVLHTEFYDILLINAPNVSIMPQHYD